MNVNVYLPDELGQQAKEAGLPISQLAQDAVRVALERRTIMQQSLEQAEEVTFEFDDDDAGVVTGRVVGTVIADDAGDTDNFVILAEDERVILVSPRERSYWELDDPEEELRDALSLGSYAQAMEALGIKPIVDV